MSAGYSMMVFPTFLEELCDLFLESSQYVVAVARVMKEGQNVVGKDVGVGVRAICESTVNKTKQDGRRWQEGRHATNVFSRRLTIHSFNTGASSSGNSIFAAESSRHRHQ